MEHINLTAGKLAGNAWTPSQKNSSPSFERKALILRQLKRIFLSFDPPSPQRLELLAEDALRMWRKIPSDKLPEAVEAAIVEAGAFPATTGLVVKVWEDKKAKVPEMDYAAHGNRDREREGRYLEDPKNRLPTEQEREQWAATFRGLAEQFGSTRVQALKRRARG